MFNQGMKTRNVYHVIILDESGSMIPKKEGVVGGFKSYVSEIKSSNSSSNHFMSLITFNDSSKVPLNKVSLTDVDKYNIDNSYRPSGMTALFDAIGLGISTHKHLDSDNSTFIFNIFTDGEENVSRECSQSQIQEMISGLRSTNRWVFNYMGVEEDAISTATAMGINARNVMRYEDNSMGTLKSMSYVARAAANYSVALDKGAALSTADFMELGKED